MRARARPKRGDALVVPIQKRQTIRDRVDFGWKEQSKNSIPLPILNCERMETYTNPQITQIPQMFMEKNLCNLGLE